MKRNRTNMYIEYNMRSDIGQLRHRKHGEHKHAMFMA
jgi:hypothetical protein